MSDIVLDEKSYDEFLSRAEREARDSVIAANDAFVAALQKQIKRGREKVAAGTFVDRSPNFYARPIRGEVPMSTCGSPAAMCTEVVVSRGIAS